MKTIFLLAISLLFIGCSSVSVPEKNDIGQKEYYKHAVGLKSLWLAKPKQRLSTLQVKQCENNGTPYIIATFDMSKRLSHIIQRTKGKDTYQEYYYYSPDFYDGNIPYKRIRMDSRGKKYSAFHGMYKGIKN